MEVGGDVNGTTRCGARLAWNSEITTPSGKLAVSEGRGEVTRQFRGVRR